MRKNLFLCHHIRAVTPKRMEAGFSLAPEQHNSEETWQQWRAVGDSASDLTGSVIEPKTFRTDCDVINN